MKKYLFLVAAIIFAAVFLAAAPVPIADAAKKNVPAATQEGDFAYRGLKLGATYAEMKKHLGEPHFDRYEMLFGIRVRYYVYGRDLKVGLAGSPARVVDIVSKDEKYRGRNDLRYGSTPYHIYRTFGEKGRQLIDGTAYYVYENPADRKQRLMLEAALANGSLVAWRFTTLPLTEEEADLRFDEFDDPDFLSRDPRALFIEGKKIDTSNLGEGAGERKIPELTRDGQPLEKRKLR